MKFVYLSAFGAAHFLSVFTPCQREVLAGVVGKTVWTLTVKGCHSIEVGTANDDAVVGSQTACHLVLLHGCHVDGFLVFPIVRLDVQHLDSLLRTHLDKSKRTRVVQGAGEDAGDVGAGVEHKLASVFG